MGREETWATPSPAETESGTILEFSHNIANKSSYNICQHNVHQRNTLCIKLNLCFLTPLTKNFVMCAIVH